MTTTTDTIEKNYELSSYHVNMHGNLTLPMLVNFLIETAGEHAHQNGFGFEQIAKTKRTWVLSRLKVRMDRLPRYLHRIQLRSWVRTAERIQFERHFQILDASGLVLGGAVTAWVAIDVDNRRPIPVEQVEHQLQYFPQRFGLDEGLEKLPELENPQLASTVQVAFSDLDLNRHVTTVRYIDWLIDAYPFDFLDKHVPTMLEIQFFKEVLMGHAVDVYTQSEYDTEGLHSLVLSGSGKEVSRARIHWRSL